MYDIIYVCNSVNNKNVRQGELKILRKNPTNKLCFEFGESEMNIKRRYYNDAVTMEKDFAALQKLAKGQEEEKVEDKKEETQQKKDKPEEKEEDFEKSIILKEEEKPEEVRDRLRNERRRRGMYDR